MIRPDLREKLLATWVDELEQQAISIMRDNGRDLREAITLLEKALSILEANRRNHESA